MDEEAQQKRLEDEIVSATGRRVRLRRRRGSMDAGSHVNSLDIVCMSTASGLKYKFHIFIVIIGKAGK